jgi:alpha-tubulin suppressor-like RCC1 family protein
MLAVGWWHSCVINDQQNMQCVGECSDDPPPCRVPLQAPDYALPEHWTAVSAGDQLTCGITAAGSTLMCWGNKEYNQTSIPKPTAGWAAVAAGRLHVCGIRTDRSLHCWGEQTNSKARVPIIPGAQWAEVAAGNEHSCGILVNGTLLCWCVGQRSDCVLAAVCALGVREIGCLLPRTLPCRCRQRSHGAVWAHRRGDNSSNQTRVPDMPGGWKSVSAGSFHTCALSAANSTVHCWGAGQQACDDSNAACDDILSFGQSKVPENISSSKILEVSAGDQSTCAVVDAPEPQKPPSPLEGISPSPSSE